MTPSVPEGNPDPAARLPVPRPLHAANEALAFLLELMALAALAWWGFASGDGLALALALGAGAPLLAAVAWGLFAAPRARIPLPLPGVLAVKAVVFGAAAAALYGVGHPALTVAFAVIAAVNTALAAVDRAALMHRRNA